MTRTRVISVAKTPTTSAKACVSWMDDARGSEEGDLATLERLASQGNATATDQLIESAAEQGDLATLKRLADLGNRTAAEVLEEQTTE
jgi:hypothetical protein